jgi:hypothetical protein
LSDTVDLTEYGLIAVAIQMPAAWDAAALTFQASADGSTYNDVYNSSGTEYTVQAAAARYIPLDVIDFAGMPYIKIRSGTTGTPVAQTLESLLTVVIRSVE